MRFNKRIKILSTVLIITFEIYAEIAINNNLHSTGQVGLRDTYSAKTVGYSKLVMSFRGNFSYDTDLVPWLQPSAGVLTKQSKPYAILYDLVPSVAFGITDFLDVSVSQPFYFDVLEGLLPQGGAGDLNCVIKYRMPGNRKDPFDGAVIAAASIPCFDNSEGYFIRHSYYLSKDADDGFSEPAAFHSAGKPSFSLLASATMDYDKLLFHVNTGACVTTNESIDYAAIGAFGVEAYPVSWFSMFADIYCEPRMKSIGDNAMFSDDLFHVSPGITMLAPGGAALTLGSTFRISSGNIMLPYFDNSEKVMIYARTEPLWKAFVQLSWSGIVREKDNDRDQLTNSIDKCPDTPEDIDEYNDNDGCPDIDNDLDNIADAQDLCKNIPEDIDGYNDQDGCPDSDNDSDAVIDTLDRCPYVPEDRDGFNDDDGCPDSDNDVDGIEDTVDKCIMVPEDIDGFDDTDGCADLDNDMDGVPDSIDSCPVIAGVAENNGCPVDRDRGKEIRYGRLILPGVHFNEGTAELTAGSLVDLDRLYYSLADWPKVKIEIQSHVDNSVETQQALELSQKRAQAVLDYLISKGIPLSRVIASGKGSSAPIADNEAVQGRALNNRIEIYRID